MKTEILYPLENGDAVNKAAQILKAGGTVAMPTETVYGLAANAFSKSAIEKIFTAKGRPQDNPLIVHISNTDMLYDIVEDVPEIAIKLAKRFWPGPFTMILKRNGKIPACVSAGLDTVAVRCPDNKIARELIEKSGLPLAAPSANLSGKPSPTTAQHVIDDLSGKIDAVLVGNECTVGVESTVITLVGEPKLLRPGAVTVEELKEFLPQISVDKAVLSQPKAGEKVASPGMKYKHYAPKTETYLCEGNREDFVNFVNCKENSVAVCFLEEANLINIKNIPYGSENDQSTLAKNVFAVLRNVDSLNANAVYVHAPNKSGVGLAVYNRLIRAAAFRVIEL